MNIYCGSDGVQRGVCWQIDSESTWLASQPNILDTGISHCISKLFKKNENFYCIFKKLKKLIFLDIFICVEVNNDF